MDPGLLVRCLLLRPGRAEAAAPRRPVLPSGELGAVSRVLSVPRHLGEFGECGELGLGARSEQRRALKAGMQVCSLALRLLVILHLP